MKRRWMSWAMAAAVAGAGVWAGCQTQVATQQDAQQYALTGEQQEPPKPLEQAWTPLSNETDRLEVVSQFTGPMPTGVAVSKRGRVFVSFPRWQDPVAFTVAELRDGKLVAFPDEQTNRYDTVNATGTLLSVQTVEVDAQDRLWLLDSGNINMTANAPNGPKLVCVNLQTNRIERMIGFPTSVALPTTYLNDVRFDLGKGKGGVAYITDSSAQGPNGIIVVDLASGESWRKLNEDTSTKADQNVTLMVEGMPLKMRVLGLVQQPKVGADGIALSPDGNWLYYRPLISHHLYRVPTEALRDRQLSGADTSKRVEDLGDVGFASDGIRFDAQGRLYLTDYEHQAVRRGKPGKDAKYEMLVQDPRLIWPDTLAMSPDGWLYVTSNQLDRGVMFQGYDRRVGPYALFRVKTDGRPMMAAR